MVADASQLQWKQQISSLNQRIHNTQKSITTRKSWVSAAFSVISLWCLVSRSWAGSNNDTSLPALLFVQIQPEREQDIDKRSRGGKIWLERNFRNNEARRFHATWDCFKSTCKSSAFSVFTSSSLGHEGFETRHHGQQQNIFNGFLTYGLWLSHRSTERSRCDLDKEKKTDYCFVFSYLRHRGLETILHTSSTYSIYSEI